MKKTIWMFLYRMASSQSFCAWVDRWLMSIVATAIVLFGYGIIGALYLAPADYQQGDAFRIIYIHVPCAMLSLSAYSLCAFCAVLSLVWRIKMADLVLEVVPAIGASFTGLALITGAIWGKPMWGTWWIWDARLTSELILFFLYIAIIALRQAIPERQQASRAVAIFVLVGFIDIPLIHYSVYWWNTLHQGSTITAWAKPAIAGSMLKPLLAMIGAFFCYFIALTLYQTRSLLLTREHNKAWVKLRFAEERLLK